MNTPHCKRSIQRLLVCSSTERKPTTAYLLPIRTLSQPRIPHSSLPPSLSVGYRRPCLPHLKLRLSFLPWFLRRSSVRTLSICWSIAPGTGDRRQPFLHLVCKRGACMSFANRWWYLAVNDGGAAHPNPLIFRHPIPNQALRMRFE